MSDSPFQPGDGDSTELARVLREATRHLMLAHGALDGGQRPCGTPLPTANAWAFLELLQHGPMTVTALASRLSIDRTNVSRLCDRMESLGEVERSPHPDDKRARLVGLTESGTKIARSVDASSAAHFQAVLGRLAADPASVVHALTVLARAMHAGPTTTSSITSEPGK